MNSLPTIEKLSLRGPVVFIATSNRTVALSSKVTRFDDNNISLGPVHSVLFVDCTGISNDITENFPITKFGLRSERVAGFKSLKPEDKAIVANNNAGIVVSEDLRELDKKLAGFEKIRDSALLLAERKTQERISIRSSALNDAAKFFRSEYEKHASVYNTFLPALNVSSHDISRVAEVLSTLGGRVGTGDVRMPDSDVRLLMSMAEITVAIANEAKKLRELFIGEVVRDKERVKDPAFRVALIEQNL